MQRLCSGHDAALNSLMTRHADRLFHYLLRLLQNETEASELAHETFVRVYQNRARYKPNARFSTWLYTIATNLARDLKRSRARHPQVSIDAPHPETGNAYAEILPEQSAGPADRLQTNEQAEAVRRAVLALPEDLREPLILSEYEDRSHAEIGAILGCSAKAVEMRLYRARKELREALKSLL